MAAMLLGLLVVLPPFVQSTSHVSELLGAGTNEESARAVPNGYISANRAMTNFVSIGSVSKYEFNGSLVSSFTPITGIAGLKGIETNAAGTRLYTASEAGVTEYMLSDTGATVSKTFDASADGVGYPVSVCLSKDEAHAYVTQYDSKYMKFAPSNTMGALYKLRLSDGAITVLFRNVSSADGVKVSPNGCHVFDNKVWMVSSNHPGIGGGVYYYDLATNMLSCKQAWFTGLQGALDGIALYNGYAYVSTWSGGFGQAAVSGTVHQCMYDGGNSSSCTSFASVACADMKLDLFTPDKQPLLLCPSPPGGTKNVHGISLTDTRSAGATSNGCSTITSTGSGAGRVVTAVWAPLTTAATLLLSVA